MKLAIILSLVLVIILITALLNSLGTLLIVDSWIYYLYYLLSGMIVLLMVTVGLLVTIIVDSMFFPGSIKDYITKDAAKRFG